MMNRPNQLTTARIILTPIFVYLLLQQEALYIHLATVVFILAAFTDYYDGLVARKYGHVTEVGKFLDPLADKVLVVSGLLTFVALGFIPLWMVLVIVARDVVITLLRVYARFTERSIVTSVIAKWKTFSQMVLMYLILFAMNVGGVMETPLPDIMVLSSVSVLDVVYSAALLVTIFTLITGVHYLVGNRQILMAFVRRCFRAIIPSDL
jgi:CDP-diacylglycerol---glycerol-3-phosphate 3-phosphatidyltransferase